MVKVAINLLPAEFTQERVKSAKFYKIQALGIGLILVVVFLSSFTVALGMLQSRRVEEAKDQLGGAEQRVTLYKNKEVTLMALKNRLKVIDQYSGASSLQVSMFNLLNAILPQSLAVNNLSISRTGEISISAVAQSSALLDEIISDFTNKNKNQGKVESVSIESLSRSRDGVYRVDFKIKPKS